MAPHKDKGPGTKKWLGCQDSNLGMQGSKPCALPLGDTPIINLEKSVEPTADV